MVRIFSLFLICAIAFQNCSAVPASKRLQRSPQFGFPVGEYPERIPEYPEYPPPGVYPPPGAFPPAGALPPAGSFPPFGAYPERGGATDSFASANAGSVGNGGGFSEGQSQASSQSASINFGPLSATFSNSESSADSASF